MTLDNKHIRRCNEIMDTNFTKILINTKRSILSYYGMSAK